MSTLKQIAAAAGVHLTTAAAVLNGSEGNTRVGAATRDRVISAARRLGYVRNESARRLRTGQSNTVGFIGGDLRNPFFSELASTLERELQGHGLQLVVSHVAAIPSAAFVRTVETLRQQTIGRIVYWDESASRTIPALRPGVRLFPVGFTTRPRFGVWLDLGHALRLAVSYLAERGHRRLGFYAPRGHEESPSVLIRQRMFSDECRRLGLPAPRCLGYDGESWNIGAAVTGARELAQKKKFPDALIGFNDVAALGLLLAGGARRDQPPVVCFDGTSLTRSWPGSPPYLHLKIPELVTQVVAMVTAEKPGVGMGRKGRWLQPELVG